MNYRGERPTDELVLPTIHRVDVEEYPYDFRHDVLEHMIQNVPKAVDLAVTAAFSEDHSYSYRGLLVGATGQAYKVDRDDPKFGLISAGNFKAKLKDEEKSAEDVEVPKNCAEMHIELEAETRDYSRIGMFVVAATPRKNLIKDILTKDSSEDYPDFNPTTLWPCDECDTVMLSSEMVDGDTIIMTVGLDQQTFQVQTSRNLHQRHRQLALGKTPRPLKQYRYRRHDWEERASHYTLERRRRRLKVNVYDPNKRREAASRALAAAAMTDDL